MFRISLPLAAIVAGILLVGPTPAADDDKGFTPLFNGKDFSGIKFELGKSDPTKTWSVVDGVIVCTGKPNGYFYTDKSFKDYHLKLELKYARPKDLTDDSKFGGNSGVLIHLTGDHKVWPKSVEIQGMNKDLGGVISIGAPNLKFKKDAEAQKKAIKPVGEWNVVEVISKDGAFTSIVNGTKVAEGTSDLKEGPIAFQSEGAEIHFKNIRIKEMK